MATSAQPVIIMGNWMLVTGFASLFAGDLSGMKLTHCLRSFAATLAALRSMSLIPKFHSVPAQADHRQGRDASRRSGDCLPRRSVVEEGRSQSLENAFAEKFAA
jgi:hypothetical protein